MPSLFRALPLLPVLHLYRRVMTVLIKTGAHEKVKANDGELTVSQSQHSLLGADIAKRKHGPITIKERQSLVQQAAPELRHVSSG